MNEVGFLRRVFDRPGKMVQALQRGFHFTLQRPLTLGIKPADRHIDRGFTVGINDHFHLPAAGVHGPVRRQTILCLRISLGGTAMNGGAIRATLMGFSAEQLSKMRNPTLVRRKRLCRRHRVSVQILLKSTDATLATAAAQRTAISSLRSVVSAVCFAYGLAAISTACSNSWRARHWCGWQARVRGPRGRCAAVQPRRNSRR